MTPPYSVLNPPKRCAAGHPLGSDPSCHWCNSWMRDCDRREQLARKPAPVDFEPEPPRGAS